jgi:prefoldin subunit 5
MAEEGNKVEVSEEQLIQMAQQEENELMAKRAYSEKVMGMLIETEVAKEVLKELKKTDGKIMVSVGATILVEAEVKKTTKCKRGIAENAYKEETIEDALKWLEEKEEKTKRQLASAQKQIAEGNERLTSIVGIIRQIEAEKRKHAEKQNQPKVTISK